MRRLFQHGTFEDAGPIPVKPWRQFIVEGLILAAILYGLAFFIRLFL